MTALWPVPAPEPLSQLTPTTAWSLDQCGARVGFAHDPATRGWARPTERSALGSAVHAVHEQAQRGEADASPLSPTDWVKHAWEQAVERESARLAAAWAPAVPPPPRLWPGHNLTRVRTVRHLAQLVNERRGHPAQPVPAAPPAAPPDHAARVSLPAVEVWFRDPARGLAGKPDRVEMRDGRLRVVDLKSGSRQSEPSEQQRFQLLFYAGLCESEIGRQPDDLVIVDASGREQRVPFTPAEVHSTREKATTLLSDWSQALQGGSIIQLASPSEETCRWCPFRVVCSPFANAHTPEWRTTLLVGEIVERIDRDDHSASPVAPRRRDSSRVDQVRLTQFPRQYPGEPGDTVIAVDVDLLGVDAARVRWDSRIRVIPTHAGA